MSNKFLVAFNGMTQTANGAATFKSSGHAVLDFFSQAGAMRGKFFDAWRLFEQSLAEDELLAMKALFHLRDVRGGQGERDLFRCIVYRLSQLRPGLVIRNLALFPEYGRWDDLLPLLHIKALEQDVLALFRAQLRHDLQAITENKKVSLLGKWLPSLNARNAVAQRNARIIAMYLDLSPREYRQMLSLLRRAIGIVESQMSHRIWGEINYGAVPSRAAMIYRKAFKRHDGERYNEYIEAVQQGKAKINAGALFPYDLVHLAFNRRSDATIDAQWNALPDYLAGRAHSGIVVCDTSGSMAGRPIEVAISLAMYIAERNKGAFKDHFITFSASPKLKKIIGSTLAEKVRNLNNAEWGRNTNLQAVFSQILMNGIRFDVPQEDMPQVVYIVSDMQFDQCVVVPGATNFEMIAAQYKAAGYTLPSVVFWNVNATPGQSPVQQHQTGVALVSGFSPSIFTTLLKGGVEGLRNMTPLLAMLDKLNSERYAQVRI